MNKRNLVRLRVQSGVTLRHNRKIDGIFEIILDKDDIKLQMERASRNKSRESWCGAIGVRFQNATPEEADYLMRHGHLIGAPGSNQLPGLEAKDHRAATPVPHKATEPAE